MADKVKVTLLRPLDGMAEGAEAEFDRADAERLADYGAVRIIRAKAEHAPANKMDRAPTNKARG
jgi:hypothetical protein